MTKNIGENDKVRHKGQFTKGDSRVWRTGRPKGVTKEKSFLQKLGVLESKAKQEIVKDNDKRTPREIFTKYITVDKLAALIVAHAMKGNIEMIKLLADHFYGKPVQRTENLNVDLIPKGIEVVFIDKIEKEETKEIEHREVNQNKQGEFTNGESERT